LSACRFYPCRRPHSAAAERRNLRVVPVLPSGNWIVTLLLQPPEEALLAPVVVPPKEQAVGHPRAH